MAAWLLIITLTFILFGEGSSNMLAFDLNLDLKNKINLPVISVKEPATS